MIINHNMNAMNAQRQMGTNMVNSGKAMEKLSSGLRINRAGDDAAGLAISEKMRGQIRGLDQAGRNAQDSISMIQTAEGALNETHSILQRMRELAVQSGNDTNTGTDRGEIQKEVNQLSSEINRIGNTTEFNNQKLMNATAGTVTNKVAAVAGVNTLAVAAGAVVIDGKTLTAVGGSAAAAATDLFAKINADADLSKKYTATDGTGTVVLTQKSGHESATSPVISGAGLTTNTATTAGVAGVEAKTSLVTQIGANQNQTMTLDFTDMRSQALGITGTSAGSGFTASQGVTNGTDNTAAEYALDVSTSSASGTAVTKIQGAIDKVSAERSKLGAYQNRLEHTIANLGTSSENLTAAESRIRDVDMAKEMMNFSKNNILSQAAQAMLAQANQQPQGVLQLLR